MFELIRLAERPRHERGVFFTRYELSQLLSLYSRRVALGEWRDYAIDHLGGMAVFSVFRHTHESPLFAIAKTTLGPGREPGFSLFRGRHRLKSAPSIAEVLSVVEKKLRLLPN